jgi:hypothetical protein
MKTTLLFSIILIVSLLSCNPNSGSGGGPNPPAATKGRMDIKLTDDPGQFAYFKIDIAGIDYNESGDPNTTSGWVSVPMVTAGVIDIIQYSNGRELPLASLELLPATVRQLRIRFGTRNSFAIWSGPVGGNYAFFDMPLHPSIQNGLVLPFNVNVQAGATNRLYFDFNAATSRVQTGSTSWQFLPTVRVF